MNNNTSTGSNINIVNVATVLGLVGIGWVIMQGWNKLQAIRTGPILIGTKDITETKRTFVIDIPTLWVPYKEGDTKAGMMERYTPSVRRDGLDLVIYFQPIEREIAGVKLAYTPDPVRVGAADIISTVAEQAALITKLIPSVSATTDPVGWNIDFPIITIATT